MKKFCGKNKGFSLVELIIVIAIMAILVGVMAPQLLKYIEKSKVSSDLRSLDAIYKAVVYASNDSTVVQDDASVAKIAEMDADAPITLESLCGNTLFEKEIRHTLGWPEEMSEAEILACYRDLFTSYHNGDPEIYVQYKGGFMNPLAMWITHTDISGKKGADGIVDAQTWRDLEKADNPSNNICIK